MAPKRKPRCRTNTAASLGRAFGYFLVAFGVLSTLKGTSAGLWFAVIGFFLVLAAGAERLHEQVVTILTGVPARALMSQPAVSIPAEATLDDAAEQFRRDHFTAFPAVDRAGRVVGMLRIDQVEHVAPHRRSDTLVAAAMTRDPALLIGERTDVGQLLELPAFAQFGRAVVIDNAGLPLGVLTITDIQRAIRVSRLRESGSATPLARR